MYEEENFALLSTVLVDGSPDFGVSVVAFDEFEELLWAGNQNGHLTSYHGWLLSKYTSFQALVDQELRSLLFKSDGVLVLGRSALKLTTRQGDVFSFSDTFDFQCFVVNPFFPEVINIGGLQPTISVFSLELCEEVFQFVLEEQDCVVMRNTDALLVTGHSNGKVCLRDPMNMRLLSELQPHSGSLSDVAYFDNKNDLLSCDPFIFLYDARTMNAIASIPVQIDPYYIRFIATQPNKLVVVSQVREFQIIDFSGVDKGLVTCLGTDEAIRCLSIDVSPTGECIAFGDEIGTLHVFSNRPHPIFVANARSIVLPDPIEPTPTIPFDDLNTPLSIIPMPITGLPLLSTWPEECCKRVYRIFEMSDTDEISFLLLPRKVIVCVRVWRFLDGHSSRSQSLTTEQDSLRKLRKVFIVQPIPIPQEVTNALKMTDFVGYAPNPYGFGRKRLPYRVTDELSFASGRQASDVAESIGSVKEIPSHYQKALIHHKSVPGKFVECKQHTVRTSSLCGLEAPIPNSYVNSVLLMLYHVEPLRRRVLSHLCKRVFCLTCELSFLFHMLQQSTSDFSCSAINFIRAFRTIPEASALGLVLNDREDDPVFQSGSSRLIQNFNRFILHHMNVEMKDEEQLLTPCVTSENAVSLSCSFAQRDTSFVVQKEVVAGSASTEMVAQVEHQSGTKLSPDVSSSEVQTNLFNMRGTEDLFATSVENVTQCRCGYQSSRADLYFVCALSYPTSDEQLLEKVSFEKLLEQSFHLEQVKHAWCEQCSKFRISTHRRWIRSLPDVLSINCNIDNDKIRSFWRRQQQLCVERPTSAGTAKSISSGEKLLESNFNASNGFGRLSWLPFNLHILLDADGKVTIYDRPKVGSDTGTASNAVFYELQAVISYIKSGTMGHWVACIKALSNDSIRRSRWYLVNDTQVNEIIPLEAVNFDVDWKVPCILLYSRPNLNELHPDLQCSPIDDRVFTLDRIISERPSNISTVSTKPACLPGRDDLVAIDAEFVTLNHEEAEIRSDGSKLTFKPSQLSLARITCVYGSGPLKGDTLLDDYICTREEISDYVTKFSGIKPGDLDPTFADRPLTAMKVAYLKLRYLIDVGVKFVGHGLSNDFKVINIYVPKEQIIDTVQLFRLPRRRLVSLRFLIWHFFGIRIQSGTHDSDEDARSALMLYEKYTDIIGSPELQFSHILNELYEHGQQLHWNVPAETMKS